MAYPQYPEGDQEVDELVSDEDGNQGRGASQGGADGSDGENDGEEMGSHDEADLEEAEEGTSGWKCEWDGCGREWKEQIGLVRHLEKSEWLVLIPHGGSFSLRVRRARMCFRGKEKEAALISTCLLYISANDQHIYPAAAKNTSVDGTIAFAEATSRLHATR